MKMFGFDREEEVVAHHIHKLMPDMYAKHHAQVFENAFATENPVQTKQRLVYAKHRSGFVFPVWLELRVLKNAQGEPMVVAMFKTDKKMVKADLCYVLVNRDDRRV